MHGHFRKIIQLSFLVSLSQFLSITIESLLIRLQIGILGHQVNFLAYKKNERLSYYFFFRKSNKFRWDLGCLKNQAQLLYIHNYQALRDLERETDNFSRRLHPVKFRKLLLWLSLYQIYNSLNITSSYLRYVVLGKIIKSISMMNRAVALSPRKYFRSNCLKCFRSCARFSLEIVLSFSK